MLFLSFVWEFKRPSNISKSDGNSDIEERIVKNFKSSNERIALDADGP